LITHLWLIRHAKSSWSDLRQADFDRPLNERGMRDGPRMQRWLHEQPNAAQWIWTSDAARALATAKFVHAAWPWAQLVREHALYHADPRRILEVVHSTPAGVSRVAVVAHNPGMTWAVNQLAGERVIGNLPTFGAAHFAIIEDQQPTLEAIMSPKRLP
jgi:phosphohistidine phosphatase|tara:strand:- start:787 stop:1260 length:474 start_codon:yes stop_codon:yes gene_type:complete